MDNIISPDIFKKQKLAELEETKKKARHDFELEPKGDRIKYERLHWIFKNVLPKKDEYMHFSMLLTGILAFLAFLICITIVFPVYLAPYANEETGADLTFLFVILGLVAGFLGGTITGIMASFILGWFFTFLLAPIYYPLWRFVYEKFIVEKVTKKRDELYDLTQGNDLWPKYQEIIDAKEKEVNEAILENERKFDEAIKEMAGKFDGSEVIIKISCEVCKELYALRSRTTPSESGDIYFESAIKIFFDSVVLSKENKIVFSERGWDNLSSLSLRLSAGGALRNQLNLDVERALSDFSDTDIKLDFSVLQEKSPKYFANLEDAELVKVVISYKARTSCSSLSEPKSNWEATPVDKG